MRCFTLRLMKLRIYTDPEILLRAPDKYCIIAVVAYIKLYNCK